MIRQYYRLSGYESEHNYRRWAGKPGVLKSTGSQRVRHELAMEKQQQKHSTESVV